MMKLSYSTINASKTLFFLALLIFALPYYFYAGGTWWSFLILVWASSVVNTSHNICWHRWLCHNSFTPHFFGKWLMLFSTSIQGNYRPLFQISAHRLHHKYPDLPEDPHSPKHRSLFMTWLGQFDVDPTLIAKQVTLKDLRNKELLFIQKYYYHIFFTFYAIFLSIDVKTALLFLGWTYTYMSVMTALISYYSHYDGVNYGPRNMPRLWCTFSAGEGLHLTHHTNPRSWTFASDSHPVDPGARFVKRFLMKHPN